jgi:hypothetical protein
VLWSSDNLATKAIINGGLRQVDQFGQKAAVEGNFKISVNATPGQAEIQKTDIFKIKHKNVIMNLSTDANNGFQNVTVDNLPAGEYNVYQSYRRSSYSVTVDALRLTTVDTTRGVTCAVTTISVGSAFAIKARLAALNLSTLALYGTANAIIVTGLGRIYLSPGGTGSYHLIVTAGLGIYSGNTTGTIYLSNNYYDFTAGKTGIDDWISVHGDSLHEVSALQTNMTGTVNTTRNVYIGTTRDIQAGSFSFGGFYGLTLSQSNMVIIQTAMAGLQNASIMLEVTNVNTATGEVTFRAQVNRMGIDGTLESFSDDNLIIGALGVKAGYDKLGFTFLSAGAIRINSVAAYDIGDKIVLNSLARLVSAGAPALNNIAISARINS